MDTGVGVDIRAILQEPLEKPVYLPKKVLSSLQKELNVSEAEITSFIISLIERTIASRIEETSGMIFSESETEEIENDLKGLGYI